MAYILCAIGASVLVLILSGCGGNTAPKTQPKFDPTGKTWAVAVLQPLSRDELRARLHTLSQQPVPAIKQIMAMCYTPAPMPSQATYICPACGAKTGYVAYSKGNEADTRLIETGLPALRREMNSLKTCGVTLDESEFCRKCSPAVKKPKLAIVVKRRDGSTSSHVPTDLPYEDIEILATFFKGETLFSGTDRDEPGLRNKLPRLLKLLDVKPEEIQ